MFKQDSLENISKMLYGNKYNKKEEGNNNSFLNQSKDNNSNNYKIKPIKDSTPQELLYGVKKQEDKNKEDKKTYLSNIKPIKDLTPQELLYGIKDKEKERKNSTPIENLKTRQEYLKRGYSTKNDGLIPGINGSSLKKEEDIKNNFDNNKWSKEEYELAKNFIGKKEALRTNAYKDTGGVWTIGYGHTGDVQEGDVISKDEAERLYEQDFYRHANVLRNVKVKLNSNEKAALASLAFNIGENAFKNSTLLKKLNQGDKKGAADEFDKWIFDNGKVQKGLINRRQAEKQLFLKPDKQ